MEEIWKDIEGYDYKYQVSNIGEVRKIENKNIIYSKNNIVNVSITMLKQHYSSGYLIVRLVKNGKEKTISAHRLVALTFLLNLENKPEVNHINGIKDDNRIENLEWATYSENSLHSLHVLGNIKNKKRGGEHFQSKKVYQYDKSGKFIKLWNSLKDTKNAGYSSISNCCLNKAKSIRGFIWSYTELSSKYFNNLKVGADCVRKPVYQITKNGEIVKEFPFVNSVKDFGFCPKKVSTVCNGHRKYHGGFIWAFKEN